jgi:hypothetical protein
MDNLPEIDIGLGETDWQVHPDPFVAYFKRGKVYTIDGFRFLALGGALSIDRAYRTRGLSWWPKEYWPEQEKEDVLELLETENNFDFVLSHTGPCRINRRLFGYQSPYSRKFQDEVAFLNDKIDFRIQCCGWWCGHWHKDICHCEPKTNRSYQYLYKSTKLLYRENGKIVIDNEDGASTACEH